MRRRGAALARTMPSSSAPAPSATAANLGCPCPVRPRPGTGKTLTVSSKLLCGMPGEFLPLQLTFSARTSANMVQDIIGGFRVVGFAGQGRARLQGFRL
jgi:hypothetical protein